MKRTTLYILAALAAAVSVGAQGRSSAAKPPLSSEAVSRGSGQTQDEATKALIRELDALNRRGRAAELSGDYATAEAAYRRIGELMPHTPRGPFRLARLYDRMGRERDAFAQYRLAVADYSPWSTNHRDDPIFLTRYGNLSEKYGTRDEAGQAYALAATLSNKEGTNEPPTVPRNPSFGAVKAAAHAAAGVRLRGYGRRDDALRSLDAAVRADPDYWIAHYYRADLCFWMGFRKEMVREAALAERLAPTKDKEAVRTMRRNRGIPDAQGKTLPLIPVQPTDRTQVAVPPRG